MSNPNLITVESLSAYLHNQIVCLHFMFLHYKCVRVKADQLFMSAIYAAVTGSFLAV